MVVICVNNSSLIVGPTQSLLTVGNSYELVKVMKEDEVESIYVVIDDRGQEAAYRCDRFIPLSQIRSDKLKQLGI